MDEVEIRLKITKTATEDAAHCNLREDDLAVLGAVLMRDPTAGTKNKDGEYRVSWREFKVTYLLNFAKDDAIVLYVMRISEKGRRPRDLSEFAGAGRQIAINLITRKIEKLLGDDE